MRAFAAAAVLAFALVPPAFAADYKPVTCQARQSYQGRALRPAIAPPKGLVVPDSALPAATAALLDQTFDKMRSAAKAQALGIAVGQVGRGLWARAATPAEGQRLWWASAGKAFVATAVLQLAEEGKLSLDDPVSRWVKGVPNGDVVTVRDLLAHTSGLFSANEDLRVHADPHALALDETLRLLQRHGAMFCPGANWRYSNSGYDLLAAIVEAIDHRPLRDALNARIAGPLGLSSVIVIEPGQPTPEVAPPSTVKPEPAAQPSMAGAGGPIAASPADMVRFWSALLGGRLLKPASVTAMFETLYPMFDAGTYYGLGVMVLEVNDGDRHDLWLGHAGGAPGSSAMLAYSPADNAIVAVALTGDAPAAAVANGVLKSLRTAR